MSIRDRAGRRLLAVTRSSAWISIAVAALLALLAILAGTTRLGQGPLRTFLGTGVLRFTLRAAVPLIFGALSGILCERSGIINIGIEGMMLTAAFTGFMTNVALSKPGVDPSLQSVGVRLGLSILAALLTGGILGLLHALLSIQYKVNQIVSGTVINILAVGLTSFARREVLLSSEAGRETLQPMPIPILSDIPVIGDIFFNGRPIFYAMFILLIATMQILLFRSRWGCGRGPSASTPRGRHGGHQRQPLAVHQHHHRRDAGRARRRLPGARGGGPVQRGMTAGRGFISLAAMIFGNWSPVGALGAATLFGYTQALQNELLLSGVTTVPRFFVSMLPYVTTIVVLAGFVGRTRPPAAEGEVYETE